MQEALYSATFKLYQGEDYTLLTVRSDVSAADLVNKLSELQVAIQKQGYSVSPGAPAPKTQIVEGAIRGRFNDSRTNAERECLHLYGTGGAKFKVATVYPEKFDLLPQWVKDTLKSAPEARRIFDTAPEKSVAIQKNGYIKFPKNLVVRMEPILTPDGQPKMTDKGHPMWRVGGFQDDGLPQTARESDAPVSLPTLDEAPEMEF